MVRVQAPPVPCPFQGAFTFDYRRSAAVCASPVSRVSACAARWRLVLHHQVGMHRTSVPISYPTGLSGDISPDSNYPVIVLIFEAIQCTHVFKERTRKASVRNTSYLQL